MNSNTQVLREPPGSRRPLWGTSDDIQNTFSLPRLSQNEIGAHLPCGWGQSPGMCSPPRPTRRTTVPNTFNTQRGPSSATARAPRGASPTSPPLDQSRSHILARATPSRLTRVKPSRDITSRGPHRQPLSLLPGPGLPLPLSTGRPHRLRPLPCRGRGAARALGLGSGPAQVTEPV